METTGSLPDFITDVWQAASTTMGKSYAVVLTLDGTIVCACPDFALNLNRSKRDYRCKHIRRALRDDPSAVKMYANRTYRPAVNSDGIDRLNKRVFDVLTFVRRMQALRAAPVEPDAEQDSRAREDPNGIYADIDRLRRDDREWRREIEAQRWLADQEASRAAEQARQEEQRAAEERAAGRRSVPIELEPTPDLARGHERGRRDIDLAL